MDPVPWTAVPDVRAVPLASWTAVLLPGLIRINDVEAEYPLAIQRIDADKLSVIVFIM